MIARPFKSMPELGSSGISVVVSPNTLEIMVDTNVENNDANSLSAKRPRCVPSDPGVSKSRDAVRGFVIRAAGAGALRTSQS